MPTIEWYIGQNYCPKDVTKTLNKQNKPVTYGTSKKQASNSKQNKPGLGY